MPYFYKKEKTSHEKPYWNTYDYNQKDQPKSLRFH